MHSSRLSPLLLLALAPACTLPDKVCIGDCATFDTAPTDPGTSTTTLEDPTSSAPTGFNDDDPTEVDESAGVGSCDISDNFNPLLGCGDGLQSPGELCFLDAAALAFPAPVTSAIPARLDGGGLDILVSHADQTVTAVLDGPGAQLDLEERPWPDAFAPGVLRFTTAGDLDEDGIDDVVARNTMGPSDVLLILRLAADGSLKKKSSRDDGPVHFGPWLVDRDGDAHLDIVTYILDGQTADEVVLRGDGTGQFTSSADYAIDDNSLQLAVGALDDDGRADDFVTTNSQGHVTVRGQLTARISFNLGTTAATRAVEISEFDGDGRGDFAVLFDDLDHDYTALGVFLRRDEQGEPDFKISLYPVRCGSTVLALGDLDGDGAVDIVTGGPDSPRVTIRRGDGHGKFADVVHLDLLAAPNQLHIGDFTGDGAADILAVAADSLVFALTAP